MKQRHTSCHLSSPPHSCTWCTFSGASFGGSTTCSLPTPAQGTEGTVLPKILLHHRREADWSCRGVHCLGPWMSHWTPVSCHSLQFMPLLAWHMAFWEVKDQQEGTTDGELLVWCSNSEHERHQDGDGGTATKDISTTCSKLAAKSGFSFLICVAAFTGPPRAHMIA